MSKSNVRPAGAGLPGRVALAGVLLVSGLALTGCRTSSGEREAARLRYNLTPELYTLTDNYSDTKNTLAIIRSENTRMLREDIHRVFMLDRQSRLTRAPVPR